MFFRQVLHCAMLLLTFHPEIILLSVRPCAIVIHPVVLLPQMLTSTSNYFVSRSLDVTIAILSSTNIPSPSAF